MALTSKRVLPPQQTPRDQQEHGGHSDAQNAERGRLAGALTPQLPHERAHEVRRPAPVERQRKRQLTERDDGQQQPRALPNSDAAAALARKELGTAKVGDSSVETHQRVAQVDGRPLVIEIAEASGEDPENEELQHREPVIESALLE